ncbi:MAG: T9SS type A sorting domain-containing protein [Bacteroidia bacterium]
MNKALPKILLAISIIVSISIIAYHYKSLDGNLDEIIFNDDENLTPNKESDGGPGMAPGWVDQWRTIKGLKEGEEVPFGMYREWRNSDMAKLANKRNEKTELFNLKELGPNNLGGRTRDMLIDLADSSRILACGISGGIWEGKNFGKNWRPINDYAATLSATCITQSPFEHDVIYYGTGEGSGNSAGIPGEGIFKSTDGGETFEQLESTATSNFTYTWDIKHSLVDTNTLYVSTTNRGLWRSVNAGDTFERVYVSSVDIHDIEVFPDSSIMISVEGRGIYRSKTGDLGDWIQLTDGLPTAGFSRVDIAYSENYPNVVYAVYANGRNGYDGNGLGVYKSSDGGDSWALQGRPSAGGVNFSFPWYCLTIGVDPYDTNNVAVGSVNYGFSKDGGKTWREADNSHADYHCHVFRKDEPGSFYVGNDGGIFEYNWNSMAGNSISKNDGYNVYQVYAGTFTPDSNGVLVGSQDQWSTYSQYGGGVFKRVWGGDGAFCHVHQQNPDIAYMSSQNGNLRKTGSVNAVNPGTIAAISSNVLADGVWFINPYEMNYLNGDLLFFPTRRGLWMSFDGAQFWTQIADRKINMYSVGIPYNKDPKRIYFGGDNLQLWRIEDPINATTGNEVRLNRNMPSTLNNGFIACITVHPRDDGTLYLAMSNYSNSPKVWRVDSAHTEDPVWTDISGDLPTGLPANWIETDPYRPDDYLMIGTDFGLYISKNGGETWIKEERIPNVSIHNIRLRYTDRKLFVYTHGRGVWSMNLKAMEDPFVGIKKVDNELVSIYPNPTSHFININLKEQFTYKVFGLNGSELLNGVNETQIDVSTLSKGTYIFKANTENQEYSSQFIIE